MRSDLDQLAVKERVRLYSRTARRGLKRYGFTPTGIIGPRNRYPVFVVGCPRSGTTFTAAALGRISGFADLGEVSRLKAGLPELYRAVQDGHADAVVRRIRTIFSLSQRVAMSARRRGIEQTPESTFVIAELARAFPNGHFVHLVRDGRDVVASLVERGWLAGGQGEMVAARASSETVDDAGHPFGGYARFWVEPGREREFETASEVRRCAWAWRRYESAAISGLGELASSRVTTVRYEELVSEPDRVAVQLADELQATRSREELSAAFSTAHSGSVGRYSKVLTPHMLSEVTAEAGELLTDLGYLTVQT